MARTVSIILIFLLAFLFDLLCLNQVKAQALRSLELYPTVGLKYRSPATRFIDFSGIRKVPLNSIFAGEKNIQSAGFSIGMVARYNQKLEFEYYSFLRHDYISYASVNPITFNKEFIADHEVSIKLRRKVAFGLGFSVINTGKGYRNLEMVNGNTDYNSIQFSSYNFLIDIPVKRIIDLEIKVQYVPQEFPTNRSAAVTMLSLRAYYRFNFLNRNKS
ncbi:MAG: hypothetical protein AAFX87_28440 [Bacteroidota bacterium]